MLTTTGWRVSGASVAGPAHLRDGRPCQDAHCHARDDGTGALLLAVADGAGSREWSAEGAVLAVGTAVDAFRAALHAGAPQGADEWSAFLHASTDRIYERFIGAATQVATIAHRGLVRRPAPRGQAADADLLATTLTAVVLLPPWLGMVSVGDGFVVAQTGVNGLHLLTAQEGDREEPNETFFLTSWGSRGLARVEFLWDAELTGVALSTDGLAAAVLDYGDPARPGVPVRPHGSYFTPLFEHVRSQGPNAGAAVARDLLSADMAERGADDKTILVAVDGGG